MEKIQESDILVEEELEITAVTGGRAPVRIPGKVASVFPALVHRNYQLYFFGQGISLVGFWLQAVALSWVSFQLTHSPFYVGIVAAASGLPFLFFSAFAGVFIDKTNKQRLIIYTQIVDSIIATIAGVMILTGTININTLILLALASGSVGSMDLPARQAFIVEMVGKEDLSSAVSINIGIFNAARLLARLSREC